MAALRSVIIGQLARKGFVIRRNPATRRQRLLSAHAVDLVFDVGAARGHYAREIRQFGYEGRIVSFEPMSAPYGDLASAAAHDPAWHTRNTALGDEPGSAAINIASNSDSSSLLAMGDAHLSAAPHITYVDTEQVTVTRLDDEASAHLRPESRPFLKIDTQGFERSVLAGATDTLSRCVGLQLELSFVPLYDGGMLADEAIAFAYDRGFVLTGFEQGFADPGGAILQADGVFFRP